MNKTTKKYPIEKARNLNGQIIRLMRNSTNESGFSQLNDNHDGTGFLIIRSTDSALTSQINGILKSA